MYLLDIYTHFSPVRVKILSHPSFPVSSTLNKLADRTTYDRIAHFIKASGIIDHLSQLQIENTFIQVNTYVRSWI